MTFLKKLFGYRWSLYLQNGNQLAYAMHCDRVIIMLGYVMGYFANGKQPINPWILYLTFNHKNQTLKLLPAHFTSDGDNLTPDLKNQLLLIDPDHWKTGSEELRFEDLITKKKLKISEGTFKEQMENLMSGKPRELTFYSVMDEVFGNPIES